MAYNLPPAWDAGFALPRNVRDEGLERRAFVTKWMPRGTYDDSTDGTAGYNVPQYIKDEGTGQGAFTTFWQPRGTYNGGKVPHWLNKRPTVTNVVPLPGGGNQVTVQTGMGDDAPVGEPFDTYGQRAATVLISSVAGLPQGQRQKILKAMMDRLDKSLWLRTQDIFNRYVQQKMAPADAFPLALARALSTGIAAEIITTGVRRVAPQANSLLGLGCYGCAAFLGAMGDTATWGGIPQQPITAVIGTTGLVTPPPPDFWVGPFGFDTSKLVDRVWAIGAPSPTVANRAAVPDAIYVLPGQLFLSGSLPTQATEATLGPGWATGLPNLPGSATLRADVRTVNPELLAWIKARLTEAVDSSGVADKPVHYTDASEIYGFPEAGAKPWFDAIGVAPETPIRMHKLAALRTTAEPFARTKHIKTGANMVLELRLAPAIYGQAWDAVRNPMVLQVWLSRVPDPSLFGALWNPMILIDPLAALSAIDSVAAGVAPILGDLACDVLTHPAAGAAAGAIAAAEGIPPQVGTGGVALAAGQCGQAPPPPVVAPSSSIWPWVILGGGAVVAVALLTKPKKATP